MVWNCRISVQSVAVLMRSAGRFIHTGCGAPRRHAVIAVPRSTACHRTASQRDASGIDIEMFN